MYRRPLPNDPFWRKSLKKNWNESYGDRRQEIVFTTDMDERISPTARCLPCSRKARMDIRAWANLPDPSRLAARRRGVIRPGSRARSRQAANCHTRRDFKALICDHKIVWVGCAGSLESAERACRQARRF